jgi:hypothetical protein
MERPFIEANKREFQRLERLVSTLTDQELDRPIGDGWTVAVTLAHLAFWDHRSLVLLRRWRSTGKVDLSPIDIEITNESLMPLLRAISPRASASLACSTAERIHRELENYPVGLIADIEAAGERYRLDRWEHWKWHLDRIEEAVGLAVA